MASETKNKSCSVFEKLSIDELIDKLDQSNSIWLKDHPNHYLSQTSRVMYNNSDEFTNTCCEVTAANIRTLSGLGDEWLITLDDPTFEQIQMNDLIFQITVGEDWSSPDHILTIWGSYIIQSYYKHYKPKVTRLTPALIDAINNINKDGNYQLITGVNDKLTYNANVFYWLPLI